MEETSRSTTCAVLEENAAEGMNQGDYNGAIKKFTRLLETDPESSSRWLLRRGNCYLLSDQPSKALEDGRRAVHIDRMSVEASLLCGKAATQLGLFSDALSYYKSGLVVQPKDKAITEGLKQLQKMILEEQRQDAGYKDASYSALSLCSQSVYPGDDELLKLEKEILEVKYKILEDEAYTGSKIPHEKDVQLQTKFVQAAYECLKTDRVDDSLMIISKAVAMDPHNTFYRTFRAQVYFNMGNWAKVIQDYWVIPKPQRKADVWKQGGKAFVELWLPVLAEFWFRKATQLSGGKDEEAGILFQKVRVKRLYDPLSNDQPVKVDFSQFGRAVFAEEDIAQGELVMKDLPMVMAQSLTSKHIPACFNCATSLITAKDYFRDKMNSMTKDQISLIEEFWPKHTVEYCPHCKREKYCSKVCRNEAWSVYHQIICPHFNSEGGKLYDLIENDGYAWQDGEWVELWGGHYSFMILVKIWAIIVSQVKSLLDEEGLQTPTVEHWARAKAPFRRFIAYGTISVTKRMPKMLPLFQSLFSSNSIGPTYEITEAECTGRFYQAACNLQCYSPSITPYHLFMNNIKSDVRAVGILKYLQETPPDAQFAAMFPLHACCNHSCYNNAEVCDIDISGRPGVQMIARRDIKKGEEIFITYIDTNMPKLLRKAWLYKSFNFWCQCQRCEFEGEHQDECANCQKRAKDGKKFATCGNCKRAWYCGTACQREAWKKGHKTICLAGHSQVDDANQYYMPEAMKKKMFGISESSNTEGK